MQSIKLVCSTFILVIAFYADSFAQNRLNRDFIKEQINKWGGCKNVAITDSNGDIALYGKNGWASTGPTPQKLIKALNQLNEDDELIDDIVLTENGYWIVLYGNNGFKLDDDIPTDLYRKIVQFNNDNEVITSITLNDHGDWVIIGTEHYATSNPGITDWLKEGNEKHGQIWTVHITNDAMVAVFENGYKFFGNVPDDLKDALDKTNINVFRLKFTPQGAFFFADRKGRYAYSL